tara:strand:- start:409 stop:762 length:354 start_codon:yes stop_codon:yes gene_type:complete
MEINVKKWSKNNFTRYYLCDQNGTDLGYVQEKQVSRQPNNNYDRHRISKGDNWNVEESHTITDSALLKALAYKSEDDELIIDVPSLRVAAGGRFIDPKKRGTQTRPPQPIILESLEV